MSALLSRLRRSQAGVTAVEFALVSPVLTLLLMGAMDIGHTLYMRAVVQGSLQKASRDSGLETGTETDTRTALDAKVRTQILDLHKDANVLLTREYHRSFERAADAREPFTDSTSGIYKNNRCDNNEPYEDENGNGRWDDTAREGQGTAKDVTVYKATVTFPRMFPVLTMLGVPATQTVIGRTVMTNQPYGDQATDANTVRNCT